MDESLMNAEEAMKYLKISKITLYRLIKKSKLPFHRVGRNYRFRKSALDKWLDSKAK